ncbi:MAG: EscU/YscU/HrcU family type III secretion system export apparatus switch protein, partial [Polyangiaceae bacterium]|nr:EscU/YscU/HrcU family type III secretion system export apparatus switch protein [Polyangiaceae bacterium]
MAQDQEKTEEPTPEKRRKAREEGNIARSKDGGAVVATAFVLITIAGFGGRAYEDFTAYLQTCFASLEGAQAGQLATVAQKTIEILLRFILPISLAAAIGGTLMGATEAGLELNWSLVAPKWNRLDPSQKLVKLFNPKSAGMTGLLTLARVFVVGTVSYWVILNNFHDLSQLPRIPLSAALSLIAALVARIAFWCTIALAVLSALDFGQAWLKREKELMMSRQELKDEHQQQEGDPKMKGRQRQRAREMVQKSLLAQIKKADVIVANPTHVAVALRYRALEGAPVVLAKGVDDIALFIKKFTKIEDT